MNGILVDDEDLHQAAFSKAAAAHGMSLGASDYAQYFAGRTDRDGFHDFLSARYADQVENLDQLLDEKADNYETLAASGLKTYEGVPGFLLALRDRGHVLALVTSSTLREAKAVIAFLDVNGVFAAVVTAEDVRVGKPDPEPYLVGAKRLGVEPGLCVVIEDAPSGVKSALAAGMRCAAVASTHDPSQLEDADIVVRSVKELRSETLSALV
jgi:sugar-phosphatase